MEGFSPKDFTTSSQIHETFLSEIDSTATALTTISLNSHDVTSLFECPVCYNFITPPILQCLNGHPVCLRCSSRMDLCPTCRCPKDFQSRNIVMEKLANLIDFPCRYNKNGCTKLYKCEFIEEHEKNCEFQIFKCPYPDDYCNWAGFYYQIINHFEKSHFDMTIKNGDEVIFNVMNVFEGTRNSWFMAQVVFDSFFLIELTKYTVVSHKTSSFTYFKLYIRVIGLNKDFERFKYKAKLSSKTRCLIYHSKPLPFRNHEMTDLSSIDGLILDLSTAKTFADSDNLAIRITMFVNHNT